MLALLKLLGGLLQSSRFPQGLGPVRAVIRLIAEELHPLQWFFRLACFRPGCVTLQRFLPSFGFFLMLSRPLLNYSDLCPQISTEQLGLIPLLGKLLQLADGLVVPIEGHQTA